MAAGVGEHHKDYDSFSGKWQRVRDVVAGQETIHNKTVAYLPTLIDEDAGEYLKRVNRTPFYNASWRTMAAFVGMLFRKPAILEVPETIKPLLKDVTMSGVDFNSFAQDVALEDIEVSRVGVLVDYPTMQKDSEGKPVSLTVAQSEKLGLRPSMVMYRTESIFNWHYEYIGNKTVLQQVRLAEIALIQKNEFEYEEERRIRVLDLMWGGVYRQRLYKQESGEQIGEDIIPLMNNKPLDFIPFYFIGPDGASTEVSEPILIDLVDLNLTHYQVSADYEHGCHFTALPTPYITGIQDQFGEDGLPVKQSYYIGSTVAWLLPLGAEAKFLEFTGQGLSALEKNLDRKENQMAAIGARMLTPDKAGVESEGALAMRHSGEHSILGAIAVAVSSGLQEALKTFCEWAGVTVTEDNVKFEINRDFMPFVMSPQAITALLGAVQAGKLSHEAYFDLMKRGDLVADDLTFEDEQARIDEDQANAIPLPVPGVNPANPNQPNQPNQPPAKP